MTENDFSDINPDANAIEDFLPPPEITPPGCWRCGKTFAGNVCPFCNASVPVPERKDFDTISVPTGHGLSGRWEPPASTLAAYIVLLVLMWALTLIFIVVQSFSGEDLQENVSFLVFRLFVGEVLMIAVIGTAWRYLTPEKIAPSPRPVLSAIFFFLLLPAVLVGAECYMALLPESLRVDEFPDCIRENVPARIFWLICFCATAPVFEEIFFRRIVLDAFVPFMSPLTAIFVSSLMFTLAHVGLVLSYPLLFLIGFYLGLARVYCNSILVPILLHGLYNAGILYWPEIQAAFIEIATVFQDLTI